MQVKPEWNGEWVRHDANATVLPKLESIVKVLTGAVAAGEAVQKLGPMLQQAIQWAQQVLR